MFTYQRYPWAAILVVVEGVKIIIMVVVHSANHLGVVSLAHSQLSVVAEMTAEISARSSMDQFPPVSINDSRSNAIFLLLLFFGLF